jgi:hypothetical protein
MIHLRIAATSILTDTATWWAICLAFRVQARPNPKGFGLLGPWLLARSWGQHSVPGGCREHRPGPSVRYTWEWRFSAGVGRPTFNRPRADVKASRVNSHLLKQWDSEVSTESEVGHWPHGVKAKRLRRGFASLDPARPAPKGLGTGFAGAKPAGKKRALPNERGSLGREMYFWPPVLL